METQAEFFFVEAGRDRLIHQGLRAVGDQKLGAAGNEECNLDDTSHRPRLVSKEYAEAAITAGRGCQHCVEEQ